MRQPTYYAKLLKKYLKNLGITVEEEVYDGHKHIDLSIPSGKIDIEVDGVQHLADPKQIITDFKRSSYSREDGYETLHVHNADLKHDAKAIASAIAEVSAIREEDFEVMSGQNKNIKDIQ